MYYDIHGQEITLEEWSQLFSNMEYKQIARGMNDVYLVSTVWLGLNHAFLEDDLRIFETMVFAGGPADEELACYRYPSIEEALEGHIRVCRQYGVAPFAKNWDMSWD